jgi:hypothetical protein
MVTVQYFYKLSKIFDGCPNSIQFIQAREKQKTVTPMGLRKERRNVQDDII